ncbi:MAG: sigma-70 family RNA polymerase sigma factor [Myxococcota bacterium]|nr:sigma-70 family RNA polymerase sigma factor [Myxococcota bacterium]
MPGFQVSLPAALLFGLIALLFDRDMMAPVEQSAKDALAREYLPLIERIVSRERSKLGASPQLDPSELRSFAMEGLAHALERFDPSRNISFKTYAELRVRGAIYDGLAGMDWFPRRLRRKINFYRRSQEMLHAYGNTPPPRDKVEAVHRLADTLKELATAYVTSYAAEDDRAPATVPAEADTVLEKKELTARITTVLESLPPKQRNVVHQYYFADMDLNDIAKSMGVTKSWAWKLLSAGLAGMREAFEADGPKEIFDTFRSSSS